MGRQKYKTEEERKEAKRLYMKQWRETNAEHIKQYSKQYRQDNAEKRAEYRKQYYTENKERELEQKKQWREKNAAIISENFKQYYAENKEKFVNYKKQYYGSPIGRAVNLLCTYNASDKKANRGECTLTARWIVDHIFNQKCVYCGESDWTKLGCDRIDNSLPHTEDNVVCCCGDCNIKRGTKSFEEFINEIR